MKNKLVIMAGAVAVLVGFNVQATPISGSIGFNGNYTQTGGNSSDLSTATSLSLFNIGISGPATTGALVGAIDPTFAATVGVNGNSPTLVGQQLWSVLVGATTYTFIVGTEAQTLGSGNTTLTLAGAGTLGDGNAADATAGTWTLGFGVSGAAFTWNATSANSNSAVPDGGTTAVLLGGALAGLGLLKRKFLA